jgi:hypothetical protein
MVIDEKVAYLTGAIEVFLTKIVTDHRAMTFWSCIDAIMSAPKMT